MKNMMKNHGFWEHQTSNISQPLIFGGHYDTTIPYFDSQPKNHPCHPCTFAPNAMQNLVTRGDLRMKFTYNKPQTVEFLAIYHLLLTKSRIFMDSIVLIFFVYRFCMSSYLVFLSKPRTSEDALIASKSLRR